MSLRARVLLGSAVIAVVLAIGAVAITRITEARLLEQVDDRLRANATAAREFLLSGGYQDRPGVPALPNEFYGGWVTATGVETAFVPDSADGELPEPEITREQYERADGLFTVDAEGGDLRYRVFPGTLSALGQERPVVLALPLDDVDDAVSRLRLVAGLSTGAALAVVALVAWWVIHLGVRPVKRMTETAAAIAGGDLSHRVPDGTPGTEAGELGTALNKMLGSIEHAFDERTRSEERLRRFIADASHELRTPITTVRGYAELYRAGGLPPGEDLDEAMRRTEQESVRMGGLIDDMLQLARLDQGRPLAKEPVDLAEVAADAARDAGAVAPDREVKCEAIGPILVSGDEDRIRQIVANVVGNALVHTDAGTPIVVRAYRAGDRARIEVVDRGAGMAPDVAERAFERFYRADPSRSRHRGGSGLGLSIVQSVVQAHGGQASIESEPGRGTTVRIDLPVIDVSGSSSPAPSFR